MSKRGNKFERRPRDFYATPPEAVEPLLPFLTPGIRFAEPCAGDGSLVDHLVKYGHNCTYKGDIEPRRKDIDRADAMEYVWDCGCIITNPPWSRDILHPMIVHFSDYMPTWLLFDADWMHTKQAAPYLTRCTKIVSVGRVSWMGNGVSSFDNCCWYLFRKGEWDTTFYGRAG
jgi:hypothetical protein